MSSSHFRQAFTMDVAPMLFTDDQKTCGVYSPMGSTPSLAFPHVPLKNVLSLTPGCHIKDSTCSRVPVEPHQQMYRFQEENLTNIKCTDWTPKRIEGTTLLKKQTLASDSSFSVLEEKSHTGNVRDMIMGLLGTEQGTNLIRTAEGLSAFSSYENEFLTNAMKNCNYEKFGGKSFEATDKLTKDGYHTLVSLEDFHTSESHRSLAVNDVDKLTCKHKFPPTRSDWQLIPLHKEECNLNCLLLLNPKEEPDAPQKSKIASHNKGKTVYKISDNGVSVKELEVGQTSSKSSVLSKFYVKKPPNSSLITKPMQQQKEKSISGVSNSRRKGLSTFKQRSKLIKESEKISPIERNNSPLPKYSQESELPKAIIKDKINGNPLVYPNVGYAQNTEDKDFIQDLVVQVSKTVDSASLKKSLTLKQNYKKSQDVFMWRDTLMKSLDPYSDCSRLHSRLVSSQENENGFSSTMEIKFNVQPSLSMGKEPSFDGNRETSLLRHMSNINQEQCFTGLFMSTRAPEIPNVSKFGNTEMLEVSEVWEDKGEKYVSESLIYGYNSSLGKMLQVPELSDKLSKSAQPKITEIWENKDATDAIEFLQGKSKFIECETLQVPGLLNIMSKIVHPKITEFGDNEDATYEAATNETASEFSEDKTFKETGTAPICKMRKIPELKVDSASFVLSEKSLKGHECKNVNMSLLESSSGIPQNPSGSATALEESIVPEQQLKLLLHASHCLLLKCDVASCAETKQLLKHCSWCREEALCPVSRCSISRNLSKHWNMCKVFHCPLCNSHRQCYGHSKLFINGTPPARSYSFNSYRRIMYDPVMANSGSSSNFANIFAANKSTTNAVRYYSLSTSPSKNTEANILPKTRTAPQRQFLLDDTSKSLNSTQCDLQEISRPLTQPIGGPQCDLSQVQWDLPFGSNDLGENLNHIFWTDSPGEDIHQETATEFASKTTGEGPILSAGFTMVAEHLRNRLDCLLHSVVCEEPAYKASRECTVKHCSIMKSSLIHMSSCSEFKLCSDVICHLFSPLFLHWKKCFGPCAVCGPINMKYNKKKLLKKLPSEFVKSEISEDIECNRHRDADNVWRHGANGVATPYYLRKYMMEEQLSLPAMSNGFTVQSAGNMKTQGTALSGVGNTWDQLTGIDINQRILGNFSELHVSSTGFLESHMEQISSCSGYRSDDTSNRSNKNMQDLLSAISMYNLHSMGHSMGSKYLE